MRCQVSFLRLDGFIFLFSFLLLIYFFNFQQLQVNNEYTEMKERKKSAVAWNYFTMENEERARCGTCGAMISFKGGSTGNLLRHLKTKHSELDLTPPVKIEEPEPSADCEQLAFEAIENKELAKFVQLLNPKYKLQGVQVPRLNDVSAAFFSLYKCFRYLYVKNQAGYLPVTLRFSLRLGTTT